MESTQPCRLDGIYPVRVHHLQIISRNQDSSIPKQEGRDGLWACTDSIWNIIGFPAFDQGPVLSDTHMEPRSIMRRVFEHEGMQRNLEAGRWLPSVALGEGFPCADPLPLPTTHYALVYFTYSGAQLDGPPPGRSTARKAVNRY